MTRVQFDRDAVVQDCTRLFWQQGFSGASMQDVVRATGLKPGSLYLAFGNKEGLYQAALEHYARQSRETLRHTLESAPSVGEGLCRQLLRMLDESSRSDYCSCFLVKSQLELAASGGELYQRICTYLGQIEDIYVEYLGRESPPALAQQQAASLMMHVFGIRVYGYLGRDRSTQVAALQSGLSWLPWDACNTEENVKAS
jgi:AcrR family transcriptional regulator